MSGRGEKQDELFEAPYLIPSAEGPWLVLKLTRGQQYALDAYCDKLIRERLLDPTQGEKP